MFMYLLLILCCSRPLYGLEPWDLPAPDIQAAEVLVLPSTSARQIIISQPNVQLPEPTVAALPGSSAFEIARNHAKAYIEMIGPSLGIKAFEKLEVVNVSEVLPAGHIRVVMTRNIEDIPINVPPTRITIGPNQSVTEIQSSLIVLDDSIAGITNDSGMPEAAIASILETTTGLDTANMDFFKSISAKPPYLRWQAIAPLQNSIIIDAFTGAIIDSSNE